ncbi:MAG: hypothetical protein HOC72_14480 [Rhodospirillaceae bacterium]|nr:hypothetical protein [Rhodospirillaceae bacterium]
MTRDDEEDDALKGYSRRERRAFDRETARARKRADKHGCACCGISLASWPLPCILGRRHGKWTYVCQPCGGKLDGGLRFITFLEVEPIWQRNDKAWFTANPDQTYRMREPIGQELAEMALSGEPDEVIPADVLIFVWQPSPEETARCPVVPVSEDSPLIPGPMMSELASMSSTDLRQLAGDTGGKVPKQTSLHTALERAAVNLVWPDDD